MQNRLKRHVAHKLSIREILNSEYIKNDGWEPNYIYTSRGKISRVSVVGFIISKNKSQIIIDDGTANIRIRSFDQNINFENYKLSDIILIIGKLREWNKEKFIVPEIIKNIDNKLWLNVWKKECLVQDDNKRFQNYSKKVKNTVENPSQRIIELIQKLDKGNGVDVGLVVEKLNIANCEQIINNLIEEGEIFNISPGKIKILD